MIKSFLIIIVILLSTLAYALDIITLNGKVYKDVKVTNVSEEGIDITYKNGVSFIKFNNLSENVKKKYQKTKPKLIKPKPIKKKEKKNKGDNVDKILKSLK